jgi:hypothetical protein
MTVVNIPGDDIPVAIAKNVIPGTMHVYCVGPGQADFEIRIQTREHHTLAAGHTLSFKVNNSQVWIENKGPSRIQLLYGQAQSIAETEGFTAGAEAP